MVRKLLHVFLVVMLMLTLLPVNPQWTSAASGDSFIFENLPTTVNQERVSLTATLSNVSSSGITYTVERISNDGNTVLQKRDKSSLGITVSTDGIKMTVTNLQLYPGKNRITFFGKRGASEVRTILPLIEYIDAPILYNLAFTGGGQKLQLSENGISIVTNKFASNVAQSLFSIEGNAPNAREVIIEFGDNESRSATVREDGTNYFIVSQVKLKKGKNTLKFRIKNDTQSIEVVRDVVYYDESVTFYDVTMKHSNPTTSPYNMKLLSNFFVPDFTAANYSVEGRVIIPNDYANDLAEAMRIESAYRLAGSDTVSPADHAFNPDDTDKIIVKFSAEVENSSAMTTADLKEFIDFQTFDATPVSINEKLQDSTAAWTSSMINGISVPNSQLVISIGAVDAVNAFNNVGRLVLKKDVVADKDVNKRINVFASNSETVRGVSSIAEVNTVTITSGAGATGRVGVTFNDGAPTTFAVNVAAGDTPSDVANKIRTALGGGALAGYVISGATDKVIITQSSPAAVSTSITISPTISTGVIASNAETTPGAAGTAEVNTLTVTTGATAKGTIGVTFNDGTIIKTVPVDVDAANTPAQVAAAIKARMDADSQIGDAGTGAYTVSNVGNTVVFTKNAVGVVTTAITVSDVNTGVAGTFVETTAGVTAVQEVNTITVAPTAGVATLSTVNVKFNDGVVNQTIPVSINPSDTPSQIATKIQAAVAANTGAANEVADHYIVPAAVGNSFTMTRIVAGSVNPTITIESPNFYTKTAYLAGSFDPRTPYVIEAYVQGNGSSSSTQGVDPGEKIIVKFADGEVAKLPSTNVNMTNYSGSQIDTMFDMVNALDGTSYGNFGTAGSRYSMIYNANDKQLEISLDSNNALNSELTSTRTVDSGVGNNKALALDILQFFTTSTPATFINYQSGTTHVRQVRLGGSFDADGSFSNPDPDTINTLTDFAKAIYFDGAQTEIGSHSITLEKISGSDFSYTDSQPYYVFKFTFSGTNFPAAALTPNKPYFIQMVAENTKKNRLAGGSAPPEGTEVTELGYTLIKSTTPYIQSLNYNDTEAPSPVFPSTTSAGDPVPVSDLVDGTSVNKMPFAIKLTIPNGGAVGGSNETIKVISTSLSGTQKEATISPIVANTTTAGNRIVWFWITKLPFDGSQTLDIQYKDTDFLDLATEDFTVKKSVDIVSVSGIAVQFNKITDGKVIQYDPTESDSIQAQKIIENELQDFAGVLSNVPVTNADYQKATQRVFLTINNSPIYLEPSSSDPIKFAMDNNGDPSTLGNTTTMATQRLNARKLFYDGQNTVKFRYVADNTTYEKTYIVTLLSINYPEIPKSPSGDIYPYSTDSSDQAIPDRDKKFTGSNGVYSTKEADMNIYGSFDFINLGESYNTINAKRNGVSNDKYILVIEGPDNQTWKWDLRRNKFKDTNNKSYSGSDPDEGLSVTYVADSDPDKQYFTFKLLNQKLPSDGTKAVYNFYVYNNGLTGSSYSSFRLEVGTSGIPYKLIRPILPQQATINQNYVEVILYSENADSMQVNKVEADKIDFDGNYDGDKIDDVDYKGAFRAIVKDLKPNKANKITYTIKRGNDTITDSFEVFYALANMPGAQFMETMKASHKVFDNKLTLTFPKDTYLRRVDYDVPENLRTQLFKSHNILFAIANNRDGVVDRYDYVTPKPPGFSDLIEDLGLRFQSSFDNHFIKASEVYWVDGGLADNPDSKDYDPVTTGLLPHQLPNSDLPSYDSVPSNRMVVPNKRGTIELAFDPNIVSVVGNNITVMRYDADNQYWENLGGQVNISKKTIKVPFDKFGYYVVAKMNDSFQDVIRHPYARNQVEVMYSKGVIKPKRSNEFDPDSNTTRGEFTAMVVRALELPLVEKPMDYSFDDVPTVIDSNSLWDYRHIETAARLGLVRGTNPRIFEPNGRITRQEASVILSRALQLKTETNPTKTQADLQKLFKDWTLIDPYARPFVIAIAKKKFIMGSPIDPADPKKGYVFEPQANMLRGDAAILLSRVMADLKKIPAVTEVR